MPRLRRADCSASGITRRRRGRGFSYHDPAGGRVDDPETVQRIAALAIPPAWEDVWICIDPRGHLQATGVDAAGRKQYRYHDDWRARRDQEKFDDMVRFARELPALRRGVARDLGAEELGRTQVLACAARMLDLGFFRIGGEDYTEQNESYGLATILKRHVELLDGRVVFDYPAKSGQRRIQAIADPKVQAIVAALRARRGGGPELLAYRERGRWRDLRSDDINEYVKHRAGDEFSAKAFRTWGATVLAAFALARVAEEATTKTSRKRLVAASVRHVAEYLGNTPAVCRRSYIDPRVIDRFETGWTIGGALSRLRGSPDLARMVHRRKIEAAVLDLIEDERTPALERVSG